MRFTFQLLDDFLRGEGRFAAEAPAAGQLKWLLFFLLLPGFIYGAVMASFTGLLPGRHLLLVYSGVKVPMFLLVTYLLCLPNFFVINTLAGLRADFSKALRATVATQACLTIVLAALSPLTALFYLSSADYSLAVFFNGVMFAVASFSAQIVMRRYYTPLIQRSPRHRPMLLCWLLLYVFVGIQMAWVLRPFIGDPNAPVAFFRKDAWGNAYVVITRLTVHFFQSIPP